VTLAIDGLLVAVTGLMVGPKHDLEPALVLVVGAVIAFVVPAEAALRLPEVRRRAWFWLATPVPAVLWIPALPWISLRVGPPLASTAGLLVAGVGLVGSVAVLVGGGLAALGVRRQR